MELVDESTIMNSFFSSCGKFIMELNGLSKNTKQKQTIIRKAYAGALL